MTENFTARTMQMTTRKADLLQAAAAATALRRANMIDNEQQRSAAIRQHFEDFSASPTSCQIRRG